MNFVAHYFLDRNYESSSFAIGAATPDLLSIYNPSHRIKAAHIRGVSEGALDEHGRELLAGIKRHFHADRVFHSSDFFAEETKEISRSLATHFPDGEVPRKYFIAHVLLELVLDKVLIDHDPLLLDDYYGHFERMDPFRGIQEATTIISGQELPNYDQFLHKFTSNRYLFHYKEWDHILFVLSRIMRRVGIAQRQFLEDKRMMGLMEKLEVRLHERFEDIFKEIAESGDSDS